MQRASPRHDSLPNRMRIRIGHGLLHLGAFPSMRECGMSMRRRQIRLPRRLCRTHGIDRRLAGGAGNGVVSARDRPRSQRDRPCSICPCPPCRCARRGRFGAVTSCGRRSRRTLEDRQWPVRRRRDQGERSGPLPEVDLTGGTDRGFAVLKDLVGTTQYLVIPTRRVKGIESPELLAPDAPNYCQDAWQARRFVIAAAAALSPATNRAGINSHFARSQNQLHIHVDCMKPEVKAALHRDEAEIGATWSPLATELAGSHYVVRRLTGAELGDANPFRLLAEVSPAQTRTYGRGNIGRHRRHVQRRQPGLLSSERPNGSRRRPPRGRRTIARPCLRPGESFAIVDRSTSHERHSRCRVFARYVLMEFCRV